MDEIIAQIREGLRLCRVANGKPVLVLINPHTLAILMEQEFGLDKLFFHGLEEAKTVFGIEIIETDKVKDFFVVDDRSWAEQKW